ncbi:hypothetical protein OG582_40705 (plasmid) [Streptomyces anulatus]|uniref:hypothetical protein n=1 Tax=Streptomyces TaxID=1883 RepID=UPI000BF18796|nr:hypothetical protein [Streptomyces sp. or20]
MTSSNPLPPVVTFTTGAPLLVELGLVDTITADGLRYLSRRRDWPFGPDKKHQYGQLGNARTMDTEVFLDYFRTGPPRGGRGRPPRQS